MKLKKYLLLFFVGTLFSCSDLDIPPRNIFGDNVIFGSKEGVNTQVARIYGLIPMEDFRYSYVKSGLYNVDVTYQQPSCLTGEAMGRDTKGAEQENNSYWDGPYKAIYEINSFIRNVNEHASSHKTEDVNTWIAEARFARAMVYFSLAKRYGGVTILETPIDISAGVSGAQLPRDSEERTWDFIKSDLDFAIASLPPTSWKGRANKYVAAAMQSRAMLFAGSIAKHTSVSMQWTKNGVLLCGIPEARATEYFKAAYDASMILDDAVGSVNYALHKADMGGTPTPASIATNFGNIFQKETKESIFSRYFATGMSTHNFDEHAQPLQTKTGGGSDEICPTVDFIEMFDGLPKKVDGTLNTLDGSGKYLLFDSPLEFFANAEPRLAATVIFPMATFKGEVIQLRRGLYSGTTVGGIDPISPIGHTGFYSSLSIAATGPGKTLYVGATGSTVSIGGNNYTITMADSWDWGAISGMYLRKYLNPTPKSTTNGNVSTQTWIEIRLAEVYLNRAEAAMELDAAGEVGAYRTMAFDRINEIRARAGATLVANESSLTLADVRKERRKELAFENKTYWDLKRWRILHQEQNNRKYRALQPFLATEVNKYFLDIHFQEPRSGDYTYNFDTKFYYSPIPSGEINKNPNCDQNNI